MSIKGPLSEQEKLRIIQEVQTYGRSWELIGSLLDRAPSTVRTFYDSYLEHQTIFPKRGRPTEIGSDIIEGVIGSVKAFPTQNLHQISDDFDISESKVKSILNSHNIKYFEKTAITPLTEFHKSARVDFSKQFVGKSYRDMPNIIFSDESLVEVDTKGGGIWRTIGEYPEEAFYEQVQHPTSVMIWGAIGPYGYRSDLLWFNQRVNSQYYCQSLINNRIFFNLYSNFGSNWVWQEDNAPPHRSLYTKGIIQHCVPSKITWPARSPDLSPIEQVWDYMKGKISGYWFDSKEQLFFFLRRLWFNIPKETIHNYYTSFLARCKTCYDIGGNSLNGHWKQVKSYHDQYRTGLLFVQDFFTKQLRPIEIPITINNSE